MVVLVETWLDKKGWEKVKGKIPKGYVWGMQRVKKVSRKGRWGEWGEDDGNKKGIMEKRREDRS